MRCIVAVEGKYWVIGYCPVGMESGRRHRDFPMRWVIERSPSGCYSSTAETLGYYGIPEGFACGRVEACG